MSGFLVVLRCTMDDFPLALFETADAANNFARQFDPDADLPIEEIWSIDRSSINGVCIVQFRNGVPVASDRVRNLETV